MLEASKTVAIRCLNTIYHISPYVNVAIIDVVTGKPTLIASCKNVDSIDIFT